MPSYDIDDADFIKLLSALLNSPAEAEGREGRSGEWTIRRADEEPLEASGAAVDAGAGGSSGRRQGARSPARADFRPCGGRGGNLKAG